MSSANLIMAVMIHVNDVTAALVWYARAFPQAVRKSLVMPTFEFEYLDVDGAVLERAPSLPFDDSAARSYARLTARLPAPERRRNVIDRMIAAHAISLDVTLVTNNERDFVAYAEAGGLRVENWVG